MSENEKTQPQELLEEVIGITHGDTPEFPTLSEQQEHWKKKEEESKERGDYWENDGNGVLCDVCRRRFRSAQALRMHVARVHTKTILTVGQQGKAKTDLLSHVGRPVETLDTHRKKWSLARRRAFNRKKKELLARNIEDRLQPWTPVPPPPQEEPVTMIKFCPHCGKGLERFLA